MTESEDGDRGLAMIELPEKTYFKIGEVAKLLEVEPYVLRYWETEFEVLAPEKTKSGQRVYQRDDIELLLQIRSLLYEEMFTIAGARRQLERSRQGKPSYFDLDEDRPQGRGTAVAGEEELRRQLESARQELAKSQTALGELQSEMEDVRSKSDRLREENAGLQDEIVALREQLKVNSEHANQAVVAELQQEIAELQQQLEQVEKKADDRRRALQREMRNRKAHRRDVLGSLRHEVETLAALVNEGPGQLR